MEHFLKRLEQKLAQQSSRRGFIGKLGTIVTALAALAAGQVIKDSGTAYAHNVGRLECCEGTACPEWAICPTNTVPLYTWSCLDSYSKQNFICTDCFQEIKTKPYPTYEYICTFVSQALSGQVN